MGSTLGRMNRHTLTYIKAASRLWGDDAWAGGCWRENRNDWFRMCKFIRMSLPGFIVASVLLLSLPGPVLAEETSPVDKGREVVTKLCARCHSVTREGESPFADAPPFRAFASKWPLESLEEALAEGIVVGHPAMPEFMFGPEDIQNILSYLGSLRQ